MGGNLNQVKTRSSRKEPPERHEMENWTDSRRYREATGDSEVLLRVTRRGFVRLKLTTKTIPAVTREIYVVKKTGRQRGASLNAKSAARGNRRILVDGSA